MPSLHKSNGQSKVVSCPKDNILHSPPPPQSEENSDSVSFVMAKGGSWLCLHLIPAPHPQETTALIAVLILNPGTSKTAPWKYTANTLLELNRKGHRKGPFPGVQDPCSSGAHSSIRGAHRTAWLLQNSRGAWSCLDIPSQTVKSGFHCYCVVVQFLLLSEHNKSNLSLHQHTHKVLPTLLHTTGMAHCSERNPC